VYVLDITMEGFSTLHEPDIVIFAKLTWQPAPGWQLDHSLHNEFWVNPEQPTLARPFAATLRTHASVPAMTFGHLTHTSSANTLWDVRVGRFVYSKDDDPSTGDRTTPARLDNGTNILSGAPRAFGALRLIRTTAKATVTQYRAGLWGVDHEWKLGVQFERGEHRSPSIIPTGVRYVATTPTYEDLSASIATTLCALGPARKLRDAAAGHST
jgi:hypothetical protein